MALPLSPAKQLANGRQSFWLVPTVASITAPTALEVNNAAALNITGYLMDDYEGITVSSDKVTLPGVLLETTSTEITGQTTISAAPLRLTTDPQAAASSDAKKPWKMLYVDAGDNWSGYLVERQNFAGTTAEATAGEFVNISSVTIQNGVMMRTSNGSDGVWISQHDVNPTQYVSNVALA